MADPIPCPKCQALLRLPAGATAARCPSCQTVITLAPPPPANPVPPPPPTASAIPLPFNRPKPAQTAPVAPVAPIAVPAAPIARTPVAPPSPGGRKPVSPYDSTPKDAEPVEDPEEKRRELKKELKRIEQAKLDEEQWLAELAVLCQRGRISMHLITWAVRAYCFAVLLQMAAMVGGATGVFAIMTLGVVGSGFFAVVGSVCFMVGFGFSMAGPYEVRHLGIMGLVVTIIHLILGIIQPGNLAIIAGIQGFEDSRRWFDMIIIQDVLGISTDIILLADHPARFLQRYSFSVPGIIVAAAEFTRLVLFSMLGLSYARGGKHPEHGHDCMKAINQIFWIVLMTASLRLAVSSAFDNMNQEDMLAKIGVGVHWSLTMGAYLSLMVVLLTQSMRLSDTIDVIDHRYWADKRERLDMV